MPPRDPVGASPTLQLLVDCVSAHRLAEASARLHRRLEGPVDWEGVVRLAHQHAVTPLVYRELRTVPAALVPPETLAALHQAGARERPALPPPHRLAPPGRRRARRGRRPGDSLQGTGARGHRVREHRRPAGGRPRPPDRPRGSRRRQGGARQGRVPPHGPARRLARAYPRALRAPLRLRLGPGERRRGAPLERLAALPLRRSGRGAAPRAPGGGSARRHDLPHAPGRRAPPGALRARREARLGAAVLDRGHRGADCVSPRPRLGGGARARRRGGPRARAAPRLPAGPGPPGNGRCPRRCRTASPAIRSFRDWRRRYGPSSRCRPTRSSGSPRPRASTSGSAGRGAPASPTAASR